MNYALPFDHPGLPEYCEFVVFDGFLPHEADLIHNLWSNEAAEKAAVSGDKKYEEELRKSSVQGLEPTDHNHWIYERIASLAGTCNSQRYRFELSGFKEPLQLAFYEPGEFFDWHMDFGAGEVSHQKLSVTVQLSDEGSYEGGDLQFMINNRIESAPRRKGTVIVFPSFLLHRVTEISAGERRSIVAWLSGTPYR